MSPVRIIPVLLYHSVNDDPGASARFTVSRPAFESHADAIKASGRLTLRIGDIASALRGERPLPERAAAITFDDGYEDTFDAVHSLLERNLSATVYVTTSEVGTSNRLTASQVAELAHMSSIEVGAHAVRHRYLDELDDHELAEEVNLSKIELGDLTQIAIGSFAYPHGAYDERVRQAVVDAGYSSAAGVKNALSHAADDPFAIARWTVTAGTPASRIMQVLRGQGVPLAWSQERVRTRAYRSARRSRRRLTSALGAAGRVPER
jgi:peptidoglycan/xylan/chitin deacetylase (PgdA/CDA1 family)